MTLKPDNGAAPDIKHLQTRQLELEARMTFVELKLGLIRPETLRQNRGMRHDAT